MKDDPAGTDQLSLPPEKLQWWRDAKFGMFIHWGVYAVPGRGEWLMWNERVPMREYAKLADQFSPDRFDADEWASIARDAGMKYMVLTTRHHDGYCLFDSQVSDFTSVKTAARRDFVAEYVTACRKAGLRVGFYYSPLDWRFPGYFFPDLYRENAEAMRQQTYDQIRELLTGYGAIDVLWYDGGGDDWLGFGGLERDGDKPGWHGRDDRWPQERRYEGTPLWEPEKLNAMVRSLQPDIIINDRSGWVGDFVTPERRIGAFETARAWETCDCLAASWGYIPDRPSLSLRNAVQLLVRVVTGDGNLLLNVGPNPAGIIVEDQAARLREVGEWLNAYGRTIYGTRGGPFRNGEWGGFTHAGNRLFVHVLDWPADEVFVPVAQERIVNVDALTAREVTVSTADGGVRLRVPTADRQAIDTIFEITLDEPL